MRIWYYKTQIKKILRFIKRALIASYYKLKKCNNNAPLIGYCENYYPLTNINEYQNENAYYGISYNFQKYSDYKDIICGTIEHGIYFGSVTSEVEKYDMPCIITFSDERKKELRKVTDRPIYMVGPYIQYVDLDAQYNYSEIKENLGKVLLVFPVHTIEKTSIEYEVDRFCKVIDDFANKNGIKTVLVSLYFNDIKKYSDLYGKKGYRIVCSGYRTDINFLQRLKAYIFLSDFVITNGIGTHIGYAVSMEKPVSYFDQEVSYSLDRNGDKNITIPFVGEDIYNKNVIEVKEAFRGIYTEITELQYLIVDKYWGLSIKRSPEEMKELFSIIRILFKKRKLSNKSYRELTLDIEKDKKENVKLIREILE